MILWIITIVTAAVLTLVLHEASHAIVVKALDGDVFLFKPWPHFHNGNFYFGRVSYSLNKFRSPRYIHIAPAIKSAMLCVVYLSLVTTWCKFLLMFAAFEAIDHLWWWKGYLIGPARTDGNKFRRLG
jgi:uncharacterized membrane protein YhhN